MLRIVLLWLLASPVFAQVPTITLVSPAQSASVPAGPLVVQFTVANHSVGNPGQSHLAIYVDSDPVVEMSRTFAQHGTTSPMP